MVRLFELEHIRIRTYHPESNGLVERFHRSTREAPGEAELKNLARVRELIGRWVAHYNEERLHAALYYLPPVESFKGAPEASITERTVKLAQARKRRERINRVRLQATA